MRVFNEIIFKVFLRASAGSFAILLQSFLQGFFADILFREMKKKQNDIAV